MYPLKLSPYISATIWGGTRLIREYGVQTEKENAAEAWVLSAHPAGASVIVNGAHAGKTLEEVYKEDASFCGTHSANFPEFPILIKFIDAMDNLSIQVHPDEAYARRVENGAGKTECWYILDAEPGAQLLLGFKKEISKEEFAKAIQENYIMDLVQSIPVKKGDFFFIPSGVLHAICKGVLLAEVQQNSNTTYRIYDYNRLQNGKPRELHVSKAQDVTKLEPYKQDECKASQPYGDAGRALTRCDLFSVNTIQIDGEISGESDETSFVSLLALEGEGTVTACGETLSFVKGESILIPAGAGKFTVQGKLSVLETRV